MPRAPRHWVFGLIALSLLSLLAVPAARAGTLIALQLSDLVAQSDLIVVARAQGESSRYERGLIVSDVSLRVVSSLKGASKPGTDLVVTHLGGSIGQVSLQVPGAAHFDLNQSALVFLRRDNQAELHVTGMSQGILPIDDSGAVAQVTMGGGDAALMQRDVNGAFKPAPAAPIRRPLASVMSEVQQLLP
jgi:hypothetical protein